MNSRHTVAELLGLGARRLAGAGAESAPATARLLLCHALGVAPSGLILCPAPSQQQIDHYRDLVEGCAAGRPAQYLIGEAWFRGLRIEVGPGVFIPRPETELVVEAAIQACAQQVDAGRDPVVIDLCTGSGAMAAALADEVPKAQVHAVELDPGALEWAGRNLAGTAVTLHAGDARTVPSGMDGRLDVVMTNPPYLPAALRDQVTAEVVDNEPEAALFSGADGLNLIRELVPRAAELLRAGGLLVVEHDPSQHRSLPDLLERDGHWCQVRDHDDLTGRPRFVTARRDVMDRCIDQLVEG
ncbi:MAG: peptide chain release factor N(5)-glutamine methyltransferase [Acidipropionibacterium sp.]|nr:peptide chain release factor N(5)-glutamine methyltransferase [Acidipropionibacterium sp.]